MSTSGDALPTPISMPENAIVVTKQKIGSDELGFIVSQEWVETPAGLAVRSGLDNCIVQGGMVFGESKDFEGECLQGVAAITVVVYMDENFEPKGCEACNVDALADMGGTYEFCAYRVEIPCEPLSVECGEPSAAPSGSMIPSTAPSNAI